MAYYILEFIRRRFLVSFIFIFVTGYIIMDRMGYGGVVTEYVSKFIATYIPNAAPLIEKIRTFLNGLKL